MARHGNASIEHVVLEYVQRLIRAGEWRSSGHDGQIELRGNALNAFFSSKMRLSDKYQSVLEWLVVPNSRKKGKIQWLRRLSLLDFLWASDTQLDKAAAPKQDRDRNYKLHLQQQQMQRT